MKVHIVTAANRDRYSRELDQMHRQRHEVFVGGYHLERQRVEDAGSGFS